MAEQVLVPLKRNDRVEEIIPYVEKVTRPSMEVVFLVRYPADWLMIDYRGDFKSYGRSDIDDSEMNWWRDRRISRELERRSPLAQGLPSMQPWENRRHVAEERFFPDVRVPLGKPPAAVSRKALLGLRAFAQKRL